MTIINFELILILIHRMVVRVGAPNIDLTLVIVNRLKVRVDVLSLLPVTLVN